MADIFANLLAQSLGRVAVVQPLIPSLFAPASPLISETTPARSGELAEVQPEAEMFADAHLSASKEGTRARLVASDDDDLLSEPTSLPASAETNRPSAPLSPLALRHLLGAPRSVQAWTEPDNSSVESVHIDLPPTSLNPSEPILKQENAETPATIRPSLPAQTTREESERAGLLPRMPSPDDEQVHQPPGRSSIHREGQPRREGDTTRDAGRLSEEHQALSQQESAIEPLPKSSPLPENAEQMSEGQYEQAGQHMDRNIYDKNIRMVIDRNHGRDERDEREERKDFPQRDKAFEVKSHSSFTMETGDIASATSAILPYNSRVSPDPSSHVSNSTSTTGTGSVSIMGAEQRASLISPLSPRRDQGEAPFPSRSRTPSLTESEDFASSAPSISFDSSTTQLEELASFASPTPLSQIHDDDPTEADEVVSLASPSAVLPQQADERESSLVHVRISRVVVRGTSGSPPTASPPPAKRAYRPALSLNEYLKRRERGSR